MIVSYDNDWDIKQAKERYEAIYGKQVWIEPSLVAIKGLIRGSKLKGFDLDEYMSDLHNHTK